MRELRKYLEELDAFYRTIEERRKYHREYKKPYRAKLRTKLVKLMGSECELCHKKFDFNDKEVWKYWVFHHWRPFRLGKGGVKEREEGWILKHLDDVSLLCKSCQSIVHWAIKKLSENIYKKEL